jgi:signal transduction histidine kinase
MGALKKLLRLIFLADVPISVAYPLRMGIYYWVLSFLFLLSARKVLIQYINNPELVAQITRQLFLVVLSLGVVFFLITVLYAVISSTDYKKIKEMAHKISRGEFNYDAELSSLADKDLKEIHDSLLRLKKSLIISWELLKNKRG